MIDEKMLAQFKTDDYTWIACDDIDDAQRIARRLIRRRKWFLSMYYRETYTFILPQSIDLDKDIREKVPGVKFTLA